MIFGMTKTEKEAKKRVKNLDGNYFAFLPTKLVDGRTAWLEKLWKKEIEPTYRITTCGACIPIPQFTYTEVLSKENFRELINEY